MKKTALLFILILTAFHYASSQYSNVQLYEQKEVSNYLNEPTALSINEYRLLIPFKYGGDKILNDEILPMLGQGKIRQINLFYSDYPKNRNLSKLNERRINNLMRDIQNIDTKSTKWNVVRQTDCNNKKEALNLFHGFEIILKFPSNIKLSALPIDSTFNDFVVEKVLKRNGWKDMLIVTDMTGSMGPYIQQLFLWLKLNSIDKKVKQFVFFNDGDTKMDANKEIGKTGGIYHTKAKDYTTVEKTAIKCIMSGGGGDAEENDIEALLKGLSLCTHCKENILIADNNSPVRDLKLLKKINKPIRIIICGSKGQINEEYLNLARKTKGSIHFMEKDLFDLVRYNEGETLEINGEQYIIQDNQFVKVKKI
jgi:hypothetical protein